MSEPQSISITWSGQSALTLTVLAENRLRFSVAHEIGHLILHGELYRSLRHANLEAWRQFISLLDESGGATFKQSGMGLLRGEQSDWPSGHTFKSVSHSRQCF